MRFSLAPDLQADIREGMESNDPFTLIWNGFCWENVIVPVYFLNGENLDGRFKVLTNALEKYHFVILDLETRTLYDPTYEKFPEAELMEEVSLRGVHFTKPMLGSQCYYFDLDYYLREFELSSDVNFTDQLREFGGRFLDALCEST